MNHLELSLTMYSISQERSISPIIPKTIVEKYSNKVIVIYNVCIIKITINLIEIYISLQELK